MKHWRVLLALAILFPFVIALLSGFLSEHESYKTKRQNADYRDPSSDNEHPVDQNNSVSLKGFKYTVMRVRHENSIGFATAENGTSYLVVDFKVKNQTPRTTECYAKFHIFSSEGLRYNVDTGATWNAKNGHVFGVDILPKFSKPVTVAFLVPTGSLSQPLTLDIQDGSSSGMIKIGPAGGALARD